MSRRTKSVRAKGKISLSKYFQEFKEGDFAAVIRERAIPVNFPERLQGRTGVIGGKRGRSYIVNIADASKKKVFLIEPIHLKRIKVDSKEEIK